MIFSFYKHLSFRLLRINFFILIDSCKNSKKIRISSILKALETSRVINRIGVGKQD